MTALTTSVQSPNVNSTDPKIADEVGVVFAHEFYTFLNKDPTRLHCFYNKHSTMSHGYQGEQIQVFNGQQAINEKILELDFEDCKVLVSNLDCQGSIHGGIVVQVLGEMSNRGGPAQKFVQTFFLAEQPKGYYVHNDIFRFLKDDYEEEQDDENEQEQEQEEDDEDLTEMYAEKAEDDDDAEVTPLQPGSEVVVIVPVEAKAAVTLERSATAAAAPDVTITEPKEPVAATPANKPEPVEPVKAQTASVAPTPAEAAQLIQPEPTFAPVQAPTPAGPPKVKSWANLAAKNTDQRVPQVATSKAATPAVVPAPVKPQTPTPTVASHNHGQAPTHGHGQGQNHGGYVQQGHGQGQGQGQGRRYPEYHSIFIKNVNDRITEEQLREAFTKFGRIKHLDMTQKKNCAFMDFATPESVVAALKQRNVQVGSEVVLAEERRRGNHAFNSNFTNNGPGGPANGRQGYYGNNNSNVNGHQQQPQGAYRGGRGGGNSNGVRGGGLPDRKPTPNKPQGVKS
ncbi:hypothetical protein KI688_011253 [Linnemannia hyalina]|uniref:NTF2-domain-containing protein n=1 Tax=Linnemannia hyalina TaxID=64524 RepID=A0A9P7XXS2_9FUNG|nr:hypothetical protein KI688_011253 [Linnemannia hyalina]